MTNATATNRHRPPAAVSTLAGCLLLAVLPGCALMPETWKNTPAEKPVAKAKTGADTPKDTLVLRGNGVERASMEVDPLQEDLNGAKRLIEQKDFAKAEAACHTLVLNLKAAEPIREEALFLEAECQRLQQKYRDANNTYQTLIKEFATSQYIERADRGLFEIAAHWLQHTRDEMQSYEEQRSGQRWVVLPTIYFHFSGDMPFTDAEGSAIRILEGLQLRELNTTLGEQALLYLGTIKFFREDFLEADAWFTQLYQRFPNGKKAPEAIKKSIMCKQLCTGGTVYDCRSVEESRKLIHTAMTAYPEFARDERWIQDQLVSINLQQADRDFRVAEFYRKTNHPGPAYFYYELVKRCYPNTEYARKADDHIRTLKAKGESGQTQPPAGPGGTPAPMVVQPPTVAPLNGGPPRILPPNLGKQ